LNSTGRLWRAVGLAALLGTLLLIGGLAYAVNDVLNPKAIEWEGAQAQPSGPAAEEKTKIDIVALGDSLTVGTGDVSGKGYVQLVRESLAESTKKPVNVIGNYAQNGYVTEQLLNDLQNPNGIAYAVGKADVVLLTIGGNDLFAIGRDVLDSQSSELDPEDVRARLPQPLARLEQILTALSGMNPNATIVYVGLYHPFYDIPELRPASVYVQQWNDQAQQIAGRLANVVFVPTFDLFQLNFAKYIYSDHFHPNQDGYARIAARVVQALE